MSASKPYAGCDANRLYACAGARSKAKFPFASAMATSNPSALSDDCGRSVTRPPATARPASSRRVPLMFIGAARRTLIVVASLCGTIAVSFPASARSDGQFDGAWAMANAPSSPLVPTGTPLMKRLAFTPVPFAFSTRPRNAMPRSSFTFTTGAMRGVGWTLAARSGWKTRAMDSSSIGASPAALVRAVRCGPKTTSAFATGSPPPSTITLRWMGGRRMTVSGSSPSTASIDAERRSALSTRRSTAVVPFTSTLNAPASLVVAPASGSFSGCVESRRWR